MGTKKIRQRVPEKAVPKMMLGKTQIRITTRVLENLYKQLLSCMIVISILRYFK
jgi:hypothetical protein